MDQMFCANQIVVPPSLPNILKKYAKAAIRTQPYDLLVWSAAYFRAMATGTVPPVKVRLEYPLPENRTLTLGYVKLLVYQFGREGQVSRIDLIEKWNDVCLPTDTLKNILRLGAFAHTIEWDMFVAITLAFLEQNLKGTMLKICEVFTEEPEGGNDMIPSRLFLKLYRYLGEMDCGVSVSEPVLEEILDVEKQPCLPDALIEQQSESDKEIDSVIKDVGDVESKMSVETRLEGGGVELDWGAVESVESDVTELRAGSEASDEGATSRYGIEVFKDDGTVQVVDKAPVGEIKSQAVRVKVGVEDQGDYVDKGELLTLVPYRKVPPYASDKDSELSVDEADTGGVSPEVQVGQSTSLNDVIPTVNQRKLAAIMDKGLEGIEKPSKLELEVESEDSSFKIIIPETLDEGSSDRETQISETSNKALQDPGDRVKPDLGGPIGLTMSLTDLRPTLDRDTRKKNIELVLLNEEQRKQMEEEEAKKLEEEKRIEEESKSKFHMYVPGIGPALPDDLMQKFEEYIRCCADRQADMVMPRNIRHFLCPPLDLEMIDRGKDIESLLEVIAEPEGVETSGLPISLLELIKPEDKQDSISVMDTSLKGISTPTVVQFSNVSLLSLPNQALGRATSLTQLLNTENK